MKAKELSKTAASYNRKKHRKDIIRQYKSVKSALKKTAKKGQRFIRWDFRTRSFEHYPNAVIALRLFRYKNRDFDVNIRSTASEYEQEHPEKWTVTISF